ncbi:MAG: hypothetical protein AAF492_01940, partial [Verrucomicrobiota bacterium]
MKRTCMLSGLVWIWSVVAPAAQNIPLVLPEEEAFHVGQTYTATILIGEDPIQVPPETFEFDGGVLTLLFGGKADVTGLLTDKLFYSLQFRKPGSVTIPSLQIERFRTQPVRVEVRAFKETEKMTLEVQFGEKTCFVGQPVDIQCAWDLKVPIERVNGVHINLSPMSHAGLVIRESLLTPRPGARNSIGLPVSNTRLLGKISGTRITFHKIAIPKTEGPLTLAPSGVTCYITRDPNSRTKGGFQYPSYFDNQFFQTPSDLSAYDRVYAHSEVVRLQVKPLPIAGRPKTFNGQFGSAGIQVEAEPLDAGVGDPISLLISMSGNPWLEAIELPRLAAMPGFSSGFQIPRQPLVGFVKDNRKVFR